MKPEELFARITARKAPAIVDVRSRGEFEAGHVPGAIHVPFWRIRKGAARIPAAHDEPVVVYCQHGPRAWMAGAALRRLGFTRVEYMKGDMHAWRKAGLDEET